MTIADLVPAWENEGAWSARLQVPGEPGGVQPDGTVTAPPDPGALFDIFSAWATDRGLPLYPHQEESLLEIVGDANVIVGTPDRVREEPDRHRGLVHRAGHRPPVVLHRADQGAGVGEVLRPGGHLRGLGGRHDHRRLRGQRRGPDHLLHRGDPGRGRAARRRRLRRRGRGDGRIPLLRRLAARLGLAGPAAGAEPGPVRADVGDPRRHEVLRQRPDRAHRPRDRRHRRTWNALCRCTSRTPWCR